MAKQKQKINMIVWIGLILIIVGIIILFTASVEKVEQGEEKKCFIFGVELKEGWKWLNPLCGLGNYVGDFASSTINVARETAKIFVGLLLVGLGSYLIIKEYSGILGKFI